MDEPIRKPAVRLAGIVKRFGNVLANNNIHLTAYPGEIHALLGENGAGKSTLMNILAGVYSPDSGIIELHGRPVRFRSPRDAIRAGIGMVHQHFAQVPGCTVAQNIGLSDPDGPFLIDRASLELKVAELCREYGFSLDPKARVAELSVGERQKLELLRLLCKQADILILDEPTAVLTPRECDEFFKTLEGLVAKGKAIIFITHKLHEVKSCADRISILRKGKIQAEGLERSDWSEEKIVSLMVGTEEMEQIKSPSPARATIQKGSGTGNIVFEICQGFARAADGTSALRNVSLQVREGEIVAVAGVSGNGQRDLAEIAMGIRRLQSGVLKIDEEIATDWRPYETRQTGVGFVPEDRMTLGICPNLSVRHNLNLDRFAVALPFFPDPEELEKKARELAEAMEVQAPGLDMPIRHLSGGNVQRAILAREIDAAARLLIVSQPTRGLDIAASAHVRKTLSLLRESRIGILLVSYDLDEIYQVADRIVVMFKGEITASFESPFPGREIIGMAMAGGNCEA